MLYNDLTNYLIRKSTKIFNVFDFQSCRTFKEFSSLMFYVIIYHNKNTCKPVTSFNSINITMPQNTNRIKCEIQHLNSRIFLILAITYTTNERSVIN